MAGIRIARRWWWLAVVIIVVAGAVIAWIAPWRSSATKYEIVKLRYGDVTQTVSASGTLNPVKVVNVGTQVSGTVQSLYVDFNSRVTVGEVLLKIDPTLFKAQVEQSTANLHAAEAALLLAKADEARAREMFSKKYETRALLDQAIAKRKSAAAQVELAHAQLAQSETNLANTVIRSPINGIIINREVDVGQTVAAAFQTPTLFQIGQDLKKMQINATVDEADIGVIKAGENADFTVDAYPEDHFKGVVTQVRLNPTVVQNVVTYSVIIDVDNPAERLLPGMTAYVNIIAKTHSHVLLVPNAALRVSLEPGRVAAVSETPGEGAIYINTASGPRRVSVKTGISDNRFTEVSGAGLQTGDEVIVGLMRPGKVRRSRSMLQAQQ